jgi:hypothetical protein
MQELVHAARFLCGDVFCDVEIAYRSAEAGGECRCIEVGDWSDPAPPFTQRLPGIFGSVAQRRNCADSGDYNSSARQKPDPQCKPKNCREMFLYML